MEDNSVECERRAAVFRGLVEGLLLDLAPEGASRRTEDLVARWRVAADARHLVSLARVTMDCTPEAERSADRARAELLEHLREVITVAAAVVNDDGRLGGDEGGGPRRSAAAVARTARALVETMSEYVDAGLAAVDMAVVAQHPRWLEHARRVAATADGAREDNDERYR